MYAMKLYSDAAFDLYILLIDIPQFFSGNLQILLFLPLSYITAVQGTGQHLQ